ncbi:MAG: hypothetical protein AAFZ11_12645 [Pseudomonadota bacterium]
MTIHFAAAKTGPSAAGRGPVQAPRARALARRGMEQVANDNGLSSEAQTRKDAVLRAALRHFAEHGLGAARSARVQAEAAFFAGDRSAYGWWLDVTRTLDRRLAAEAARLSESPARPAAE